MVTKANPERNARGQILIIFAVMLVVLLAFAALAIDGGMIFVDRRYSQSVADTAALAGASALTQTLEDESIVYRSINHPSLTFRCNNPTVVDGLDAAVAAAIARADANQVTLDDDLSDGHGVELICVDNTLFSNHVDVHVRVTSTVSTSFVHLVFPGAIRNTVDAVVRVKLRRQWAFGYSVVSLSTVCANNQGGIVFTGNSNITLRGGGVFSNSCIDPNGGPRVHVIAGSISSVNPPPVENGSWDITPNVTQAGEPMPGPDIPPPDCGGLSNEGNHTGGGTISPGIYNRIRVTANNDVLTLNPGLYCIDGDLTLTGGKVTVRTDLPADQAGVTFYLRGNANATINGNVDTYLIAPASGPNESILFYMAQGNTNVISLTGNAGSLFSGIVYAPDGEIEEGGTTGVVGYNTQLIGKFITINGTSDTDITYDPDTPNTVPPNLDMNQ